MLKKTMKIIDYRSGQGPEQLFLNQADLPEYAAHEVLVKVNAFGVNRADTLQRQGKYPPPAGESSVMGLEVAGEVIALGDQVENLSLGQRVFGLVAGGGYAEYVKIDAKHAIKTPGSIGCEQAAGIAEVFLTAYQSLFELANLQPNNRVLIHAGASGVGLAAIQLAASTNSEVAVTASNPEKLMLCQQFGASLIINYTETCFADYLHKNQFSADVIIDFVGGNYVNRNLRVLNQDGYIIQLAMLSGRFAEELDLGLLLQKRATLRGSTLRNRSDEYKTQLVQHFSNQFMPDFDSGKLTANIDTVFPAAEISQAHARLENNQSKGKLIGVW